MLYISRSVLKTRVVSVLATSTPLESKPSGAIESPTLYQRILSKDFTKAYSDDSANIKTALAISNTFPLRSALPIAGEASRSSPGPSESDPSGSSE